MSGNGFEKTKFLITNQIGYGQWVNDDVVSDEREYNYIPTPEPIELGINDIASIRPLSQSDVPLSKSWKSDRIEMLDPRIRTIIKTHKGQKIYIFENIDDVLNVQSMGHALNSEEAQLICAVNKRNRHLVHKAMKIETIVIERKPMPQVANEWDQNRKYTTGRIVKWTAAIGLALAASGGAIWGGIKLASVTDLPTEAQFNASTTDGVTTADCVGLTEPAIGDRVSRLQILWSGKGGVMTLTEAQECQTAVAYTIEDNQKAGGYSDVFKTEDAQRKKAVDNMVRALAAIQPKPAS